MKRLLKALSLALCLALGQMGNYHKLVTDQFDGTQDAYIAQFKNEYDAYYEPAVTVNASPFIYLPLKIKHN